MSSSEMVAQLRSMPYADYLCTDHWIAKRDEALQVSGNRCCRCNRREGESIGRITLRLEVHHLTYERRGAELLSDLQVLCNLCHRDVHDTANDYERSMTRRRERRDRLNEPENVLLSVFEESDI